MVAKSDLLKELSLLKKKKADGGIIQAKEIEDLRSKAVNLNLGGRSNNFNMTKAGETGQQLESNANAIADATAKNAIDFGQKISDKTVQRDAPKLDRINDRETNVKGVIDDFEDISEQRRGEITDITNRQKQIAGRQANIAAAKAGAAGVQVSEGEKQSIKDDIIAKYGQNILTAEQYELENQRTIDQDLKNIGIQEFEIQGNIDQFKDAIRDNAYAPILNALTEAKKGNQKAIDDVSSFYQEIVRKKGIEEGDRGLGRERLQDSDQEFELMDMSDKKTFLRSKLADVPGSERLGLLVDKMVESHSDKSYSFILGELTKESSILQDRSIQANFLFQKNYEDLSDSQKELVDFDVQQNQASEKRTNPTNGNETQFKGAEDSSQAIGAGTTPENNDDPIERDRAQRRTDQFKSAADQDIADRVWKKFQEEYESVKESDPERYKRLKEGLLLRIKQRYLNP